VYQEKSGNHESYNDLCGVQITDIYMYADVGCPAPFPRFNFLITPFIYAVRSEMLIIVWKKIVVLSNNQASMKSGGKKGARVVQTSM
jgi:hypothetical protein